MIMGPKGDRGREGGINDLKMRRSCFFSYLLPLLPIILFALELERLESALSLPPSPRQFLSNVTLSSPYFH